ncbi:MAG TPA: MarR family EPS-associated transcriptional regulator [Steroidobacteraceae bacterium]|nr:MarR family EPS-associated transcriptional regulator [Steroidobacteraceae bacterium]
MRYRLMQALQRNPEMSQRDLARELDVSLGRVNFCLRALIKRGLVKARNFSNSKHKSAYMYLLTPRGIEQKASFAVKYLRAKTAEYEELRAEIIRLKHEVKVQVVSERLSASDR